MPQGFQTNFWANFLKILSIVAFVIYTTGLVRCERVTRVQGIELAS
jgi:hypothetical protein